MYALTGGPGRLETEEVIHRYMAVAGMTLGLAFVLYLIPSTIPLAGVLTFVTALSLSGVALYRARKRSDSDGIDLALIAFAVNVVVLLFAIPIVAAVTTGNTEMISGNPYFDIMITIGLWGVTLMLAVVLSRGK